MSKASFKYLTGVKKLEPVKYWIECKVTHRAFWFDKKEYFVHSNFMICGPFKKEEAECYLESMKTLCQTLN